MKSAFAFLALVSLAASIDFAPVFTGNLSGIDKDALFRVSGFRTITSGGPIITVNYALFYSLSLGAAAVLKNTTVGVSVPVDTIISLAGMSAEMVPMSLYAHFDGVFEPGMTATAISNITTNLSMANGLIGLAYPAITEVDSNETVIKTLGLQSRALLSATAIDGGVYWVTESSGTTAEGINFLRLLGKTNQTGFSGFSIHITFMISSVAGVTSQRVPLVPRNVQTVIEISGWPYASKSNSIVLQIIAAGPNATAIEKIVRSIGNASAFAQLRGEATIDGKNTSISITNFASTNVSAVPTLLVNLLEGVPGTVTGFESKVKFPAGAQQIVWDPVLATGRSAYDYKVSAAVPAVVAPLLMLAAALLAIL